MTFNSFKLESDISTSRPMALMAESMPRSFEGAHADLDLMTGRMLGEHGDIDLPWTSGQYLVNI